MKKITHADFCRNLKTVSGGSIIPLTLYVNARTEMQFQCTNCDDKTPWSRLPPHIIQSPCCPHGPKKITPERYKLLVRSKHADRIVPVTDYKNARVKVGHRCTDCTCDKNGGVWFCLPQHVIGSGKACPAKGYMRKAEDSLHRYQVLAKEVGLLLLTESYKGSRLPCRFKCVACGHEDLRLPRSFVNKTQNNKICVACFEKQNPRYFSKIAIRWLNSVAEKEDLFIQHAENLGEYVIPGTRFRADGYCATTNTIYEFHGDRYHGNPDLFKASDKCHPYLDMTAGDLLDKTREREFEILSLGYNLVVMWENDMRKTYV